MIMIGYDSSDHIPENWQQRYDREQDNIDYKNFRDSGGFEDNSGNEFIGSIGNKSYYYDRDGEMFSEVDEEEDLNIGWDK